MSLGIEIRIDLIEETAAHADYSYQTDDNDAGRVRLSKRSGDVELIRRSSDETEAQLIFGRVAFKLRKHWRAGEVPASTWWAA